MSVAKQDTVMPMWHSFSYIIRDKTQFYYCNPQLRLLYDPNNKCVITHMLAKLTFQDHTDQKSGLFQDQYPITGFNRPEILFFFFQDFAGPVFRISHHVYLSSDYGVLTFSFILCNLHVSLVICVYCWLVWSLICCWLWFVCLSRHHIDKLCGPQLPLDAQILSV